MSSSVALMPSVANSLEHLVSPMTKEEFLRRYWGKSFIHIPGPKGKFSSLAPWSQLNKILEEHRLRPPRLRLYQTGQEIDSTKYIRPISDDNVMLKVSEFTNLLAAGATLILDEFDELYRPVKELAIALERIFRIHVQTNLYAGWRTDHGFLVHYDEHDAFIIQVAGRKHWQVYNPTRLYPLEKGKDSEPAEKPTEEPIWDGILEEGGFVYIPRGWWHVAYPMDEPTLHLTIGLHNPRGLDLLSWFVSQLKTSKEARMDIPHLASREEQLAYLQQLRQLLQEAWTPDLIDHFMGASDSRALSRPYLRLPESATPEGQVLEDDSVIRLIGPRRLNLPERSGQGIAKFKCQGKTLQCNEIVLPALQVLHDGMPHSLQELIGRAGGSASAFAVSSFMQALVLQGIATTVDSPSAGFLSVGSEELT
jgi:ribosomal protein L16 Arg81 hydroxylase